MSGPARRRPHLSSPSLSDSIARHNGMCFSPQPASKPLCSALSSAKQDLEMAIFRGSLLPTKQHRHAPPNEHGETNHITRALSASSYTPSDVSQALPPCLHHQVALEAGASHVALVTLEPAKKRDHFRAVRIKSATKRLSTLRLFASLDLHGCISRYCRQPLATHAPKQ